MKAAVIDRFGGPEEIYYTDIEKPVPGPDEILVRNVYIGVGKPDYIMRSGAKEAGRLRQLYPHHPRRLYL